MVSCGVLCCLKQSDGVLWCLMLSHCVLWCLMVSYWSEFTANTKIVTCTAHAA